MQEYVIRTFVWAIEHKPAYVRIRDASVGGSNSKITPKKDSRDQSFNTRVRGKKKVGRIGATYQYREY